MHKNATKWNKTLSKWCKNKHGASKIIDKFETYQAPPLLATPSDGMGRSSSGGGGRPFHGGGRSRPPRIRCGYYLKPGHPETDCYKKLLDMGRASSSGTRSSPSTHPFSVQDMATLKRILAASGSSSSTGTAGSVTTVSHTERPPSPQLVTFSRVLDSGASFHMISDSSTLSSLHSLDFPLSVLTADGTSLPVTSRGTLSTPSFSVPDISLVPRLTIYLLSIAPTADSGCRVLCFCLGSSHPASSWSWPSAL
jgi:hypothetical protein